MILDDFVLSRLQLVVSKDMDRPKLHGILVKDVDDKRQYTATNGHIAVRYTTSRDGSELPSPIAIKFFTKIKPAKEDNRAQFDITDGGGAGILMQFDDNHTLTAARVEAGKDFPNCELIFKPAETLAHEYLNIAPEYLNIVIKLLGGLTTPWAKGDHDPAVWTANDMKGRHMEIAIMPLRRID